MSEIRSQETGVKKKNDGLKVRETNNAEGFRARQQRKNLVALLNGNLQDNKSRHRTLFTEEERKDFEKKRCRYELRSEVPRITKPFFRVPIGKIGDVVFAVARGITRDDLTLFSFREGDSTSHELANQQEKDKSENKEIKLSEGKFGSIYGFGKRFEVSFVNNIIQITEIKTSPEGLKSYSHFLDYDQPPVTINYPQVGEKIVLGARSADPNIENISIAPYDFHTMSRKAIELLKNDKGEIIISLKPKIKDGKEEYSDLLQIIIHRKGRKTSVMSKTNLAPQILRKGDIVTILVKESEKEESRKKYGRRVVSYEVRDDKLFMIEPKKI